MGWIESIAGLFGWLPARTSVPALTLRQARMATSPQQFGQFCFGIALLVAIAASLPAFALLPLLQAVALTVLAFAIVFWLARTWPARRARSIGQRIEAVLPAALRSIGVELNVNTPFEAALATIATGEYGELSAEFRKLLAEVDAGTSIPDALARLGQRVDSTALKRVAAQLASAYEGGFPQPGEALKALAAEQQDLQAAAAKQYSARMAFMGLAFIAVACVVPALFQAYVVVGSAFLAVSFSPQQVLLIYVLLFPLIDAAILWAIASRAPPVLQTNAAMFSKSELRQINRLFGLDFGRLFRLSWALSALVAAGLWIGLGELGWSAGHTAIAAAFTLFGIPVLLYMWLGLAVERRRAELERYLPDALFQAASAHKGTSFERLIASLAASPYGSLAAEFRRAQKEIETGSPVPEALEKIARRNDSPLLGRAISLLQQAYRTGADASYAMREAAEDIFSLGAIVRERAASMALQRYTVLLAGGLLVPLILGAMHAMVGSLGLVGGPGLEIGLPVSARAELLATGAFGAQIYLLVFAGLAAWFVAAQEGRPKAALLYFVLLAPASLGIFALSSATNLLGLL